MNLLLTSLLATCIAVGQSKVASGHWTLRRNMQGFFKLQSEADRDRYGDLVACIEVKDHDPKNDQKLVLGDCSGSGKGWSYNDEMFRTELDEGQCMQAGRDGPVKDGEKVRMFPCDESNLLQKFEYLGGAIYPTSEPDLCMVWRGVTPNIDQDPIIFKRCGKVENRIEWSQD